MLNSELSQDYDQPSFIQNCNFDQKFNDNADLSLNKDSEGSKVDLQIFNFEKQTESNTAPCIGNRAKKFKHNDKLDIESTPVQNQISRYPNQNYVNQQYQTKAKVVNTLLPLENQNNDSKNKTTSRLSEVETDDNEDGLTFDPVCKSKKVRFSNNDTENNIILSVTEQDETEPIGKCIKRIGMYEQTVNSYPRRIASTGFFGRIKSFFAGICTNTSVEKYK